MTKIFNENVLKAIASDRPVGVDLRDDKSANSLYYEMKDLRNTARDIERRQSMGMDVEKAVDWTQLFSLCVSCLTSESKDLEVASWLVESSIRLHGLVGLSESIEIVNQLIVQYSVSLYPLADEEGVESHLAPIINLNGDDYDGTLLAPINNLVITEGTSAGPFSLWQYQQAIENKKVTDADKIKSKQEAGQVFINDIELSVSESSSSFYKALRHNVDAAKKEFKALQETIAEKYEGYRMPQAKIILALDSFAEHIRFVTKNTAFAAQNSLTSVTDKNRVVNNISAELNAPLRIAEHKNSLQSRDDALNQLHVIADYFRTTEPQSPLPYLLQRAQDLGRLSFPDLLRELVSDEGARAAAYELMGVSNASND